jgi:hypothetical protein
MSGQAWRPFLEVRDELGGKDRLLTELQQQRWQAMWVDDSGQEQDVSAAYWLDPNPAIARRRMEDGTIDTDRRDRWGFAITAPLFVRPVQAQPARDPGGRPSKYNWEGALIDAFGRIYSGPEPKTQAEIERWMQEFFAAQDQHPAESEIKKHAQPLFRALKSWGGN